MKKKGKRIIYIIVLIVLIALIALYMVMTGSFTLNNAQKESLCQQISNSESSYGDEILPGTNQTAVEIFAVQSKGDKKTVYGYLDTGFYVNFKGNAYELSGGSFEFMYDIKADGDDVKILKTYGDGVSSQATYDAMPLPYRIISKFRAKAYDGGNGGLRKEVHHKVEKALGVPVGEYTLSIEGNEYEIFDFDKDGNLQVFDSGKLENVLLDEKDTAVTFSNLLGKESQKKVDSLLETAGVSEERRKVFFDHVDLFNASVDAGKLEADFVEKDPVEKQYDPYDYQDQWIKKNPEFDGYNCRITAFSLFSDYLDIDSSGEIRDNDLFMDAASLEYDSSALVTSDKDSFLRFYSMVPTDNTTDINTHVANIQKDWQQRGISFRQNDGMSLITVWFHNQWSENENELTIGHTGVLIQDGSRYCFVEKIAFQEPYQATYFNSTSEVKDYLMKKYDVEWGQITAKPFVMENDKLMY